MKVAHALLSLFFLAPLAAEGATVNPLGRPIGIRMATDDPAITVASQSFSYSGLHPSPATLWTYFAIPFGPVTNSHASMDTYWQGSTEAIQLAPHSYVLWGSFSTQMLNGPAVLTFNLDGTWSCSGDCFLYAEIGNLPPQPSNVLLTTGTFYVEELPLPAAGGILASGLGSLCVLRRRRRSKAQA